MELEIKIFLEPEEIAAHLAEEVGSIVERNLKNNQTTYITLSGGSTPRLLFDKLSDDYYKNSIDWKNVHLFWGDERCVPPDDEQSNFGMTKKILLDKINIPEGNIHRIMGENNPEEEVKRISEEIKSIVPSFDGLPRFDLNILGLGADGHTASLFPGKKLKNIADKIAGIAVHPQTAQKRISLTLDVLNNAKKNIFMVTGEKKAEIILKIMSDKNSKKKYPAAKVEALEVLKWYLDGAAASKIKKP